MSGSTCVFFVRVDEDAVLSDSAHSGGAAADAVIPVALHRPWVRLDSEALVRWSSEIRQDFFWWLAHERLEFVSSLGRVSPQFDLWSDSSDVGWALVSILFRVPSGPWTYQCFSSFGEGGRCQSICSQPHFFTVACLIFLFSTIPTLFGQRFFSNHGMGGRHMLFPPYALLSAILLKAPLVLWGPQSPWFPELLDLVVDDSVALPLDRVLLSHPQVQWRRSGSVRTSSSYLVTIQRFIWSHVFSRRVA